MAPLASRLHAQNHSTNLRLAFDDDAPDDIEVKAYQLNNSRSESKKPERKTLLVLADTSIRFSDDESYAQVWRRGSGKLDRLKSLPAEFARALEWFQSARDGDDLDREGSEERRLFHLSYCRRSKDATDMLPLMLDVFRDSQQFFSQDDIKWPHLDRYRQEVWRDREGLLLQAFRSAFKQNSEDDEHVRDMFYAFQCLLPGLLVLSHEDSRFSTKGTYRITRCLPPLRWVRLHEISLLHIFPEKYRLCEQGLYHLGHHCATPDSSLILEFRPLILESPSSTHHPLLPWKEGKSDKSWRRRSFFS